MKITYNIYQYLFTTFFVFLCSCDFIEVDPPKDRVTTQEVYKEESTAIASVVGLYARLAAGGLAWSNGGLTVFTGITSDELDYTATSGTTAIQRRQLYENNIAINNDIASNFWIQSYRIIYHTNSCIEGVIASSLPENTKSQLLGESYFIRAFTYWYLINLYGDVPLCIDTDYETNSMRERTAVKLIKEQVLSDLVQARNLLKEESPSEEKLRVNYYTVLALLNRYYLHEQDWGKVESISSEIIASDLYHNEMNIEEVFLKTSKETIWQISTTGTLFNTLEGNNFIPSSATVLPVYPLSHSLITAFEPRDLRFTKWVGTNIVQNQAYKFPHKYKVRMSSLKSEHNVMFRLAEVYLNRAEARFYLGDEESALQDVNIIRQRCELPLLTLENTTNILDAIRQEKRIEFFAEWGHRWFDLKRTNEIDKILSVVKPNWSSTDALFPIPDNEIIANPNLKQNPGYTN